MKGGGDFETEARLERRRSEGMKGGKDIETEAGKTREEMDTREGW